MPRRVTQPAETPVVLAFLKAPRAGEVKTRLARDLGAAQAAEIYRALVERQLAQIPEGWRVEIHFAPREAEADMRVWLGDKRERVFVPQGDGDLGARLAQGFADAFARGARAVAAIGGDCPELEASDFFAARERLGNSDIVIGPTLDGGYYLIGLRAPAPRVFAGIPWSTPDVLTATLARVRELGLTCALLPMKEDVDDVASWRRLAWKIQTGSHLSAESARKAGATRADQT